MHAQVEYDKKFELKITVATPAFLIEEVFNGPSKTQPLEIMSKGAEQLCWANIEE